MEIYNVSLMSDSEFKQLKSFQEKHRDCKGFQDLDSKMGYLLYWLLYLINQKNADISISQVMCEIYEVLN